MNIKEFNKFLINNNFTLDEINYLSKIPNGIDKFIKVHNKHRYLLYKSFFSGKSLKEYESILKTITELPRKTVFIIMLYLINRKNKEFKLFGRSLYNTVNFKLSPYIFLLSIIGLPFNLNNLTSFIVNTIILVISFVLLYIDRIHWNYVAIACNISTDGQPSPYKYSLLKGAFFQKK